MTLIKVIVGSNRPNRFGIQPAKWLMDLAKEHPEAKYELVDLEAIDLPFLNEPQPPLFGNYVHKHSQEWSKIIDQADGLIIVTAEYNHGIPAPLKNAIDSVAREWFYKPVAIISYGADAGGVRAVEQLRSVFTNLRVYNLHDTVNMINYWDQLDDEGQLVPTDSQIQAAHRVLKSTAFWASKLQPIRAELKATDAAK